MEIVENAGSPKNRALLACMYTSGLRKSTLRALLYRDARAEFESGLDVIRLLVYPQMKEIDPDACKNSIPHYSFTSKDSAKVLGTYVAEVAHRYGARKDEQQLFLGERKKGEGFTHMKARTLQMSVH